jgi:hypothetical protein
MTRLTPAANAVEGLDVVADAASDALQHGTEEVLTRVGQSQPHDHAARQRIVDRRAFSTKVR